MQVPQLLAVCDLLVSKNSSATFCRATKKGHGKICLMLSTTASVWLLTKLEANMMMQKGLEKFYKLFTFDSVPYMVLLNVVK